MSCKPIIIVAGEPNSVFLEIFFKSLKFKKYKSPLIIVCSKKLLQEQMKKLKFNYKINIVDKDFAKLDALNNKQINLVDVNYNFKRCFEKISNKSNDYIKNCFDIALEILKRDKLTKFINGPISKKYFLKGKTLGITEYLAKKTNKDHKVAMLIHNKNLSVSPLTTHLALKDVPRKISKKKLQIHVKLINDFYKTNFNKKPKIAITGLNPHCESNFNNSEEDKIIIPAIKILKQRKFNVDGPYPADTIFIKDYIKKYDVIIGMYHDQVLAPMKTLFNFDAINITLGLPFIRVSPDHGPNTSMLGKNKSNPQSLIEALKFLDN
ncbi:4-hydroxythreonine-4-phosphate dehydrogenase PdxA [Candidatus Pelagibacter sp.]|nr:4-hydroxythreonine-4-phosphate dehydrogenase PdxA [Candidatus Pelagibacter sp.]